MISPGKTNNFTTLIVACKILIRYLPVDAAPDKLPITDPATSGCLSEEVSVPMLLCSLFGSEISKDVINILSTNVICSVAKLIVILVFRGNRM